MYSEWFSSIMKIYQIYGFRGWMIQLEEKRMLIFLLFLWMHLGMLLGGIFLIKRGKRMLGRSILTVWLLVLAVPAAYLSLAVAALTVQAVLGVSPDRYVAVLAGIAALVIAIFLCIIWGVLKKKKVYVPICVISGILALALGGNAAYDIYQRSIPKISEKDNLLYTYAPYGSGSKVYIPDEEPEIRFTEDIPRMDGATALYPIYSSFARMVYPKEVLEREEYEIYNNEYLQCTKTPQAYENLANGEVDVIFAAAPSDEQVKYAKDLGVEFELTPIGREAFVFFVNAKNPIEEITVEQIQQIYSGELTQWDELGVKGFGEIQAFQRSEGSGSQSTLEKLMEGKDLMEAPKEDVVDMMAGIIERTADYKNYRNALGFSFRFYSMEMIQNKQIKLLEVDGISPTEENIENGTYPLASEFYAVTRPDASENTKKLVEWIQGEQGQDIIKGTGYTPLEME